MKEHLLDIAEKIIKNSVPTDIAKKYFMLKQSIVQKYQYRDKDRGGCALKDLHPEAKWNNEGLLWSSTGKKGPLQPSSSNKNIHIRKLLYQDENQLERNLGNRIRSVSDINKKYSIDRERYGDSYNSYNNYDKHQLENKVSPNEIIADLLTALNKQLKILIQNHHQENSSLLFPSILTYFQTRSKSSHNHTIPQILTISTHRLKQLISQLDSTIQLFVASQPLNTKQIFEDNRWLIQNIQTLLKQNTVLRRMVGKQDKSTHKKKISKNG